MIATTTIKRIAFDRKNLKEFYPELRKRIDQYFEENNISKHANGLMWFKTIMLFSVWVGSYALVISSALPVWPTVLCVAICGFFTAFIGLNIAHDAIHGAFSNNRTLNKWLGMSINIIGANDYVWELKHNRIHHTYTNIEGVDDDINQSALLRLCPQQKKRGIHRFQHLYVFLLYPLATLSWVFTKDFVNFFRKQIGQNPPHQKPRIEMIKLIVFKAGYYAMFMVLPFVFLDYSWPWILAGIIGFHAISGFTLAFIFQLAHTVEDTHFPEPDEQGKLENNWAVHQLYTTANFARNNPIVCFFFGGLNFQVEHHLFPQICHVHYPKIAPIVKQTAEEYGLPYYDNPTFIGAAKSHLRFLKDLGNGAS